MSEGVSRRERDSGPTSIGQGLEVSPGFFINYKGVLHPLDGSDWMLFSQYFERITRFRIKGVCYIRMVKNSPTVILMRPLAHMLIT
jgi:hypothetical protein